MLRAHSLPERYREAVQPTYSCTKGPPIVTPAVCGNARLLREIPITVADRPSPQTVQRQRRRAWLRDHPRPA